MFIYRNEPLPFAVRTTCRAGPPPPRSPHPSAGPVPKGCERRGRGEVPGRIGPLASATEQAVRRRSCLCRARVRNQALALQQVAVLLAARARAQLRVPRKAQEPHSSLTLRSTKPEPIEALSLREGFAPVWARRSGSLPSPERCTAPERGPRWERVPCSPREPGSSPIQGSPKGCRCWGGPLPPSATIYDERDRRAASDARGRLPLLRAERARVRAAAPMPPVRMSARRADDAPVPLSRRPDAIGSRVAAAGASRSLAPVVVLARRSPAPSRPSARGRRRGSWLPRASLLPRRPHDRHREAGRRRGAG